MAATHTLIFIVCLAWLLLLIVVLLLLLLLMVVLLLLLRLLSKQINKKIGMNDLLTLNRDPLEKEKNQIDIFRKNKNDEAWKVLPF